MEMLDFDAVVVGNHDYLYDASFLTSKLETELPTFPVLAANLNCAACPDLANHLTPWTVLVIDGLRVGIFGVTDTFTGYTQFLAPCCAAISYRTATEDAIAALQAQSVDIIIGLTHLG